MADKYGGGHACRFYRVILELLKLAGATQAGGSYPSWRELLELAGASQAGLSRLYLDADRRLDVLVRFAPGRQGLSVVTTGRAA
jgi:hypothetical protein